MITMINEGYYNHERIEVIQMVNSSALTILDIGCGKGRLGYNLKLENPNRKVVGIELNHNAAAEAAKILDDLIVGDIETLDLPFIPEYFDTIILADILEHLKEPLQLLIKLRKFLKPEGNVICSIPNVGHYTAIMQLVFKGWEYKDYGIFDRTHLRFFSKKSMLELLQQAGFKIDTIKPKIEASKKAKLINALCLNSLEDFLAMQYIIRAIK